MFVTGGLSALGKGIAASTAGLLFQRRGLSVAIRKIDPYLNIDSGLMGPYQHGEVFVTNDGRETDLDLGHYERFLGVDAHGEDATTGGRIFTRVFQKERAGLYLGRTVQMIPHVTNEIKSVFQERLEGLDMVIYEIGGTVGDMEGAALLEAARQMRQDLGALRTLFLHVVWVPMIQAAQEVKTKLAQNSVKELLRAGIQPDVLLCRCETALPVEAKEKLSLFCNVPVDHVIDAVDAKSLFSVPTQYHDAGLDRVMCAHFGILTSVPKLDDWTETARFFEKKSGTPVSMAIVTKYPGFTDAFRSLHEALMHAALHWKVCLTVDWIDAELFEGPSAENALEKALGDKQGILIPGGFGERGTEGMMRVCRYARENLVPYFGICYGMHMAALEAVRTISGLKQASSEELDAQTAFPLISKIHGSVDGMDALQKSDSGMSVARSPMRLGSLAVHVSAHSRAMEVYNHAHVYERHRHLYSLNTAYRSELEKAGMRISGLSEDQNIIEIIERRDHPWFVAVQFHPEFKSKPFAPAPLFKAFVRAMVQTHPKNVRAMG